MPQTARRKSCTNRALQPVPWEPHGSSPRPGPSTARAILAFSLFYANLTGFLGLLILGGLAGKLVRNPPMIPLVVSVVLVIIPLGCLLAEKLQMLIGLVVPRHFWREYLHTLRVAMPLGIVFSTGAIVHASLRGRVQSMEEKLLEKEVAEERSNCRAYRRLSTSNHK